MDTLYIDTSGSDIVFKNEISNSPVLLLNFHAQNYTNYEAEQVKRFEDMTRNISENTKFIWESTLIRHLTTVLMPMGVSKALHEIYFKALIDNV